MTCMATASTSMRSERWKTSSVIGRPTGSKMRSTMTPFESHAL
jgi:hypothetical protein